MSDEIKNKKQKNESELKKENTKKTQLKKIKQYNKNNEINSEDCELYGDGNKLTDDAKNDGLYGNGENLVNNKKKEENNISLEDSTNSLEKNEINNQDKEKKQDINDEDKNIFKKFFRNKKKKLDNFKNLPKKDKRKKIIEWVLNNALYMLIFIFVIVVYLYNQNFLSFASIINIMMQSASRLLMAIGVAGIIVLTGTDLSAGRCLGLCACVCASLLQSNSVANKMFAGISFSWYLIPIALILSMIIGAIIGAFNGFMVSKFKLHPFIVTLGTQLILYGTVMWYVSLGNNNSAPIAGLSESYTNLVAGGFKIGKVLIPNYLWIVVFVTTFIWFIWNKTVLGKNMFAVGTNPEAATVSGVSVVKTIITVFIMAGILYGVSAFIESARVASNSTATGVNYELDAIAACVIGGVSFMGGIGKIKGVIIGVILLQLVNAGLVFLEFEPAIQTIVKGSIILIACAIDMRKYIAKK